VKKETYALIGLAIILSALLLPYISSIDNVAADTGVTVYANSGSATDIQNAVNQAYNAGGGSVYVPAGTFHWNGQTVTVPGGVSLFGASPAGCAGHEDNWKHYTATTIIINDAAQPIANPTIVLDGTNGKDKPIRLSGFQIEAGQAPKSESTASGSKGIETREAKNFRIDHCTILNFNWKLISVIPAVTQWPNERGHSSYGLVDHCFLDAPYKDNGGVWNNRVRKHAAQTQQLEPRRSKIRRQVPSFHGCQPSLRGRL
jgi:hypothetical protein